MQSSYQMITPYSRNLLRPEIIIGLYYFALTIYHVLTFEIVICQLLKYKVLSIEIISLRPQLSASVRLVSIINRNSIYSFHFLERRERGNLNTTQLTIF